MKIKIIGTPLVLNTIDNLEPNKKVWLSQDSLIFTKTGDLYLYMKAQFVAQPSTEYGYRIPAQIDEQGSITLDFTEVRFAFSLIAEKELSALDLTEYLHLGNVVLEKQKDSKDWIRRSNINELFQSFVECFLHECYPMDNLLCLHETFLARISICEDKELLREIMAFGSRKFKEETGIIAPDDEQEAILEEELEQLKIKLHKRVDDIQNLLDALLTAATTRIKLLPQEDTEESMQAELDKRKLDEDWLGVKEVYNAMIAKGFTPKEEGYKPRYTGFFFYGHYPFKA